MKEKFLSAVKELRKSKKRNFNQSVDLIINLKNFDLKKESVKAFVTLPNKATDKTKICVVNDKEMKTEGVDVITIDRLSKMDQKELKELERHYDFFLGVAKIVPKLAKIMGKILGPKGKMPDPSIGAVLPSFDEDKIKNVIKKLVLSVRLRNKGLSIKCKVGKEDMEGEQIVGNCIAIYDAVIKKLPRGKDNIKNILLKLTMSKPIKIII